jgi:hypothetical protein
MSFFLFRRKGREQTESGNIVAAKQPHEAAQGLRQKPYCTALRIARFISAPKRK